MNQKGSALVILFLMGILLLSGIIVGGSLYIKNNHPEWIGNVNSASDLASSQSNISNVINNSLTKSTPCVKFNYPSDFTINPKSVIKTTKTIIEGVSEYGTSLLMIDKQIPGKESYGMIISCRPSQWSGAQKDLLKSNLETLRATLNSDISSGNDPVDQSPAKYDLTMSQVDNIQNNNNLTATKIIEVYYTQNDSLWNVTENISVVYGNHFYQFHNGGSAHDEESIKTEIKQFEDLFQNTILTNPINN